MSVARYISIQSQDAGFLFALNTRFEDIWNILDQSGVKIGSTISGGAANQVLFANSLLQLDSDAGLIYTKTSQTLQAKHLTIGDGTTDSHVLTFHGAFSDQTISVSTYSGIFSFSGSFQFPYGVASFGTTATDGRVTLYSLSPYLSALYILGWSSGTTTYAPIVIGNTYGVKTALLGSAGTEEGSDYGRLSLLGNASTNAISGQVICYDRSSLSSLCGMDLYRGSDATSGEIRFWVMQTGVNTPVLNLQSTGIMRYVPYYGGYDNRVVTSDQNGDIGVGFNYFPYLKNPSLVQVNKVSSDFASGPIDIIASAPTVGGTGYTAGDVLTITANGATVKVQTVAGGVVTALYRVPITRGTAITIGTGKATTGGTGTGCTVAITSTWTDLYTVPANKKAIVMGCSFTPNGTLNYWFGVKHSADSTYRHITYVNGAGSFTATTTIPYIFDSGDIFSVSNVSNTPGLMWCSILIFDSTSPVSCKKLTTLANGDNTIYKYTGGRSWIPMNLAVIAPHTLTTTTGLICYICNDDPSALTTPEIHFCPSDAASGAGNLVYITSAGTFARANQIMYCSLVYNDAIKLKLGAAAAAPSWAWVCGMEV